MDVSSAMVAYDALKAGKEILSGLLKTNVESDVSAKVSDVMTKLGQAQDTLFELREQLFTLQEENGALRAEISKHESWESTLTKYELRKTAGGAVVYAYKGEPGHYACPSCIQEKRIQILQDKRVMTGMFACPACKATFPVDPPSPQPPTPPTMRTV